MVEHTDMDVAEHGGPGSLRDRPRNAPAQQYQMLEEPTGIKKLLTPADSQGINHAIPEHKVMDYIADLPREQHEHVMNVLRPARTSVAVIWRTIKRSERSARSRRTRSAGCTMPRRTRTAAGTRASSTTLRTATRRNAATLSRTAPTSQEFADDQRRRQHAHMDKHYPGAAAQAERTGLGSEGAEGGAAT
jgi:hypothetical protein